MNYVSLMISENVWENQAIKKLAVLECFSEKKLINVFVS